jgi:DNA-binding CsgD family transcriptional regulator
MDIGLQSGVFEDGDAVAVSDEGLGEGLSLLMDELAHGVLVVSLEGQLLHANQAARHELARRRVVGGGGRLISGLNGHDARSLQDALAKAAEGKRCLLSLSVGQGPALTVAVLPLKEQELSRPGKAALVFARASVCESLMLCFFARSHGLTHTEEQVLGILCQGYSAPEIASQLNVAVSTVRSHVRALCAKTRSSGVRELVKRVAVLPPVAPALWKEPLH